MVEEQLGLLLLMFLVVTDQIQYFQLSHLLVVAVEQLLTFHLLLQLVEDRMVDQVVVEQEVVLIVDQVDQVMYLQ